MGAPLFLRPFRCRMSPALFCPWAFPSSASRAWGSQVASGSLTGAGLSLCRCLSHIRLLACATAGALKVWIRSILYLRWKIRKGFHQKSIKSMVSPQLVHYIVCLDNYLERKQMVHLHFTHSFFFFNCQSLIQLLCFPIPVLASDSGTTDLWRESLEVNYLFTPCKGLAICTFNGFLLQCVYVCSDGLRSPLTPNVISHKAICKSH